MKLGVETETLWGKGTGKAMTAARRAFLLHHTQQGMGILLVSGWHCLHKCLLSCFWLCLGSPKPCKSMAVPFNILRGMDIAVSHLRKMPWRWLQGLQVLQATGRPKLASDTTQFLPDLWGPSVTDRLGSRITAGNRKAAHKHSSALPSLVLRNFHF